MAKISSTLCAPCVIFCLTDLSCSTTVSKQKAVVSIVSDCVVLGGSITWRYYPSECVLVVWVVHGGLLQAVDVCRRIGALVLNASISGVASRATGCECH